MNSPDQPFRLIGGQTEAVALRNRINAIDRINYLVGNNFDLRSKTSEYRFLLDMEMYQRWYKNEPKDKIIDEEYCQRAAQVIRDLEQDALEIGESLAGITERVKEQYKQHLKKQPIKKEKEPCELETFQNKKESCTKMGFITSILSKLKKR